MRRRLENPPPYVVLKIHLDRRPGSSWRPLQQGCTPARRWPPTGLVPKYPWRQLLNLLHHHGFPLEQALDTTIEFAIQQHKEYCARPRDTRSSLGAASFTNDSTALLLLLGQENR